MIRREEEILANTLKIYQNGAFAKPILTTIKKKSKVTRERTGHSNARLLLAALRNSGYEPGSKISVGQAVKIAKGKKIFYQGRGRKLRIAVNNAMYRLSLGRLMVREAGAAKGVYTMALPGLGE